VVPLADLIGIDSPEKPAIVHEDSMAKREGVPVTLPSYSYVVGSNYVPKTMKCFVKVLDHPIPASNDNRHYMNRNHAGHAVATSIQAYESLS